MDESRYTSVAEKTGRVRNHASSVAYRSRRSKHENDSAIASIRSRIKSLSRLAQGWDGYNACPISHKVIDNINAILESVNESDLYGWRALPEINGTISLQNDSLRSGIQVGDQAFSYYIINGDKVEGEDGVSFAIPLFLDVLRKING